MPCPYDAEIVRRLSKFDRRLPRRRWRTEVRRYEGKTVQRVLRLAAC
jgi:hypothetical protein